MQSMLCLCSNSHSKASSLANSHRYTFMCYTTVCLQALQQHAIWPRLRPHWSVCEICREDPEAGPTVAGLSKVKVDSVDTIFALLQVNSFTHSPTASPLHPLTFSTACLLACSLTHSSESCEASCTALLNPLSEHLASDSAQLHASVLCLCERCKSCRLALTSALSRCCDTIVS